MADSEPSATILVVDDTPANLGIVVQRLEKHYFIVVAQDGEEAIERATLVAPDLILMDIMMPGIDGWETCRILKSKPETRHIPIIFMTALDGEENTLKSFSSGGVDVINKPFHVDEVLARVRIHLSLQLAQQKLRQKNLELQEKITECLHHEATLAYQATHDSLTGLPNRALFHDRLSQSIQYARRYQARVACLFLDLDRFKFVNDTLGHHVGDILLQMVASRLARSVRQYDTVARFGGDEFAILVERVGGEADIDQLAQRILLDLSEPLEIEEAHYTVTASIGVSVFPGDGEDADLLLKHADVAMYRVKEEGGNNFHYFTQAMQKRLERRMELERSLRNALVRNEFVLHYQPQIELEGNQISAVEALIRWPTEDGSMLAPDDFIPVAEESHLIVALGEWVVTRVCSQIQEWKKANIAPVPVAINISASHFHHLSFAGFMKSVIQRYDIDPALIELEITETASMKKPSQALTQMKKLTDLGISLAIDDFGIGYSNLSYLKRFPVKRLKIDQSFVAGIESDDSDRVIVRAIIQMSKSLDLTVVAEGVETAAQLAFLKAEGVDLVQGFLFSEAVESDKLMPLLKESVLNAETNDL